MDPVKYMIGNDLSDNFLNNLPCTNDYDNNEIQKTKTGRIVLDKNNIPYVDGFFFFYHQNLQKNTHVLNGLEYYGSHIGFKKDFKVNVIDDIEDLIETDFLQII